MNQNLRQFISWFSVFIGVGFFVWLLTTIDLKPLEDVLISSGHWVFGIGILYGLSQFAFTIGWIFPLKPLRISIFHLFFIFCAGNVANYAFQLTGEPFRAGLLKPAYSLSEGMYSVTVGKFCELLGQALLYLIGLIIVLFYAPLPIAIKTIGTIVLGGFFLTMLVLFYWQKGGLTRPLVRVYDRVVRKPINQETRSKLEKMDRMISNFYRKNPKGFFLSVFFKFLGKLGGVLELGLVFILLGRDVPVLSLIAMETLILLSNDLLFFIPGRVGGAEASRILVFLLMGYPASEGLIYAIIRRIREIIWVGVGVFYCVFRKVRWNSLATTK